VYRQQLLLLLAWNSDDLVEMCTKDYHADQHTVVS